MDFPPLVAHFKHLLSFTRIHKRVKGFRSHRREEATYFYVYKMGEKKLKSKKMD